MFKLFARIAVYILFVLLILSFAAWGVGDIFYRAPPDSIVAKVGHQVIGEATYIRRLRDLVFARSQSSGRRLDAAAIRSEGLDRQVLRNLVAQATLDQETQRLNLIASPDQLREAIRTIPAFQDEAGLFDRRRLANFLRREGLEEEDFQDTLQQDILRNQLVQTLMGAARAPRLLVRSTQNWMEERREARYVILPDPPQIDEQPTQAQLQEYVAAHPEDFSVPSNKEIALLYLRVEDFSSRMVADEAQARRLFSAQKEELSAPEQRSVRYARADTKESLEAVEDRLIAAFAAKDSDSPVEGVELIDLGLVKKADLYAELAEEVFGLPAQSANGQSPNGQDPNGQDPDAPNAEAHTRAGMATEIFQTPFGWYLVWIDEVVPGKEAVFSAYREEFLAEAHVREAQEHIITLLNAFDDALAKGESTQQAAERLGMVARTLAHIDSLGRDESGAPISGLPPPDDFLPVLNRTRPGEDSAWHTDSEGNYFLLRVLSESSSKARSLDEVRASAIAGWQHGQRRLRSEEEGAALVERLREKETLDDIALERGLIVHTPPPLDRRALDLPEELPARFVDELFLLHVGEAARISNPRGDSAPPQQIVLVLTKRLAADPARPMDASLREVLDSEWKQDLLVLYLEALQENFGAVVEEKVVQEAVDRL